MFERVRRAGTAMKARADGLWRDRPWGAAVLVLFTGLLVTIVLNAWVCDDAYITFRVVDNVIHGHGFVWNVGERVQTYTNPLLMLVMVVSSFITREVYFTSLLLSIAASTAAAGVLVTKVSRSRAASAIVLLVLVFCGSFVTYATSGLENCLIFLLTAVFFWKYLERDRYDAKTLTVLTAVFALSIVNRMDTALLLAPALLLAYLRNEHVGFWRLAGSAALGLLPFVAWEAFSLLYYGFLFPNTAYAKLNTGIPTAEYLVRGAWYYVLSGLQDPIVLLGIVLGSVAVLSARRLKTSVALVGVALYLGYILKIGGDFMRGRYFTAPLFVVALLFASIDPAVWRAKRVGWSRFAAVAVALVIVQNVALSWYAATDLASISPYGIYNDKAAYFPASNLVQNLVGPQLEKSPLVQTGERLRAEGTSPVVRATLGFTGYYAGPDVYIVDPLALSDALLARLPAIRDPEWDIGHAERYIPEGYLDTLRTGENRIADPDLARYYDKLMLVTRGGLWSPERWQAIRELNTGELDGLVDRDYYRNEVESDLDMSTL